MTKNVIKVKSGVPVQELVIREGEALPVLQPQQINIVGQINSPYNWLKGKYQEINFLKSHIIVDEDAKTIMLVIDDKNQLFDCITGKLITNPDLDVFGINTTTEFEPEDLAQIIRMNKFLFKERTAAMKLHTELRKFNGKIRTEIEKQDSDQGNKKFLWDQTVEHNAPKEFTLYAPILKGGDAVEIHVDFVFRVKSNYSIVINLISPNLREYIADNTESLILEQIDKIKELVPDITIVYK